MNKFKLYEDVLSHSWNRYFYDVEADTIEEAVEKVKDGEVDYYDSEQIYGTIDELSPEDNNGNPTREIYNDKDKLIWHNAKLVNRGEIITQGIRNISENLSLIIESEPELFIGENIALSTITKVMKSLGWEIDRFETNGFEIDYWIYFIKDNKDFSYKVSGSVLEGEVKIEKYYELQD